MTSARWLVAAAFAGTVACSSIEQGIPGGGTDAGTGRGGTDAGPGGGGTDAGTGGGGTDAGPAGGATDAGPVTSTDGGTPGTGNVDAGPVDAGPVSDCDGLAPASLGAMTSFSASYDSKFGVCGVPVGNGNGVLAQLVTNNPFPTPSIPMHAPTFTLINASGRVNGNIAQDAGGLVALGSGFLDWAFHSNSGSPDSSQSHSITALNDSGFPSGVRTSFVAYAPPEAWLWADLNGGAALAGTIQVQGQKDQRRVMAFDSTGAIRWGPRELSIDSPVFGLGVDLNGRVLVVQSGYAQCSGCILGQWFDRNGTALTGSFTLIEGFVPGPATWFEMAPLIGGGLALRRVDSRASGQIRGFTSTWLLTIDSGSASVQGAPAWLTSRNDTDLALARGAKAYAVLANGADGARCTQKLELLSPSGNSCGSFDLAMTNDNSACDTWELRLGLDGTVVQHLPAQLEQALDSSGRTRSCTIRFWPAALK